MSTAPSSVSVVVPVAGRCAHLRRLLAGLRIQTVRPDEVIVVDMDGSLDLSVDVGSDALDQAGVSTNLVRLAHAGRSLPLARARNLGAQMASRDVRVFLDVDCIPDTTCVADYLDASRQWPHALLSGNVRYLRPDWLGRDRQSFVPHTAELLARSDPSASRPERSAHDIARDDEYDLFWSLNFACTEAAFDRVGGFDESYTGYGAEDTDFGRRARVEGVPLVWLAGALAFHQWHEPSRFDPALLPSIVANARLFRRRWGDWPMRGWLADLAAGGLVEWEPDGSLLRVTSGRSQ